MNLQDSQMEQTTLDYNMMLIKKRNRIESNRKYLDELLAKDTVISFDLDESQTINREFIESLKLFIEEDEDEYNKWIAEIPDLRTYQDQESCLDFRLLLLGWYRQEGRQGEGQRKHTHTQG